MRSARTALFALAALAATPTHAQEAVDGRQVATQRCQACHGVDGIAKIPVAPNLAGESAMYLKAQIEAFRSGERQNEMMSVVAKDLGDAEIDAVVAWYESIQVTVTLPE